MVKSPSPKDSQCPHCKRFFTKRGLKEHLRHVKCSPTSTATPKKFERARCKYCSKIFHSGNSLRVHVAGQHPAEYAKSPHSVKRHKAPLTRKSKEPRAKERDSPKKSAARPGGRTEDPLRHVAGASVARASADAERTRRVWEEILRRQQLQLG